MLQESYERDDRGNLRIRRTTSRSCQYIDIQRGKTELPEDQAQHLVKIYGEYQDEARHKVLEYEKRHHEMVATVDLLDNFESDGKRKMRWLARTKLNKRGEALLLKLHSINQ